MLRISRMIPIVRLYRFERVEGNDAMEPGLGAEVEEQADLEIGCSEVAVYLPPGLGMELQCGLHFYHEPVVDDQVETLGAECYSLVAHDDADLSRHTKSRCRNFTFERRRINLLEKAEAQGVVDIVERPDDGTREPLLDEWLFRDAPRMCERAKWPPTETPPSEFPQRRDFE